jgi:hypothetical protein
MDVDALGERAAVGMAQLGGDDAGWFLAGRHRRGQGMAQQVGWAASPTLAAKRAKARVAWLGLTAVPRSARNTRSSSTG